VQFQERQLVPVSALEGDTPVAHGKESAAAKTQRIASFQRNYLASFVDRFYDAGHFSTCKLPLEHRPDCVASFYWLLRHLVIDGVRMVERGQAGRIGGVEPLDPEFDDFPR
jgi:hypothetical protein